MSRVEEERQAQQLDQKRLQEKTAKEKAAAADKFNQVFTQNKQAQTTASQQKQQKEQKEKQQETQKNSQGMFLARQGIVRGNAERLMKSRDEQLKNDKDTMKADKEAIERREDDREVALEDNRQGEKFDAQVQQRDDKQQSSEQQNNGQSGQGGGKNSGQGSGQQSGQQESGQHSRRDREDGLSIRGVKKSQQSDDVSEVDTDKKVIVGQSSLAAISDERAKSKIADALVEEVVKYQQNGLLKFQIQLKDDTLGGGTLTVSMEDNRFKLSLVMKDAMSVNLLESSQKELHAAFKRKNLTIASIDIKQR